MAFTFEKYGAPSSMAGIGTTLAVTTREMRVMSDVWDYVTFVEYLALNGEVATYSLGCQGMDQGARERVQAVVIDATDAVKAAVEAFAAPAAALLAAREAVHAANVAVERDARKGETVIVTARRAKVPHGTTGVLFWTGAGQYGVRVGFRTAPDAEPTWTALANVARVVPASEHAALEAARAEFARCEAAMLAAHAAAALVAADAALAVAADAMLVGFVE